MAPKKTRAQASSSQPLPDTSKPSRAGKKRRLSDASNTSNVTATIASTSAAAPAKRRKRGRVATSAEPEMIDEAEELDELNVHHEEMMLGGDATVERTVEEIIEVSQPKHVHFGSDDARGNTTTATNLTPHPNKMTVKRRFTLSPAADITKRVRTSMSRSSLPPAVAQDDSTDPTAIIQELQFAPLRAVLDERVRRRLRRSHLSEELNDIEDHRKRDSRTQQELEELRTETAEKEQRINELALELETQRQFAIDVSDDLEGERVQDLERELITLRNEMAAHRALHGLESDVGMPDDHMLVLHNQEQIAYPQLPEEADSALPTLGASMNGGSSSHDTKTIVRNTKTTIRDFNSFGRTSLNLSQASWDEERRKFEDAIMALSGEANDARARLQILEIELRGLGFGGEDVDSKLILSSIRESFDNIRESLDTILPDSLPDNPSTQDMIEILIANVKEFADRLRFQDHELHKKDTLVADLGNQIQGLLDHLADAEIRKNNLEQQWRKLDEDNESKAREIEELEEELQATLEDRDALQFKLDEKVEEAKALGMDHGESVKNIEKLTLSLENYRTEETRLMALITRMEKEYRANVAKMNKEREQTVQDLENRLDLETGLREEVETLAEERQTTITKLELTVDEVSTERDTLQDGFETAKAERDTIQQDLDSAETELTEKETHIADLETRVDRLEVQLEELDTQLTELRTLNDTERHQREAAENDLDDRNVEIDNLNTKLHNQGKEANELRLKLFEIQQQNAQKVKELELVMAERDERFQTDFAAELTRREAADDLASDRAATIAELEGKIEEIELQMRDGLAERDERIAALEEDVAQRDGEIENLRMDLRSVENTLDVEKTQYEDRAEELNTSILVLQETITKHETTIQLMQTAAINTTDLHNSEMEDRNAEIAELHADVTALKAEISTLENEKAGLERRVEQEAEQMLELQNDKEDEIAALKATINDKQSKILVVEQKAREADMRWQEVLEARDEEIEMLKTTTTTNEESILTLTSEYEAFKTKFRNYVARTRDVIGNLQAAVRTAKTVADDEGDILTAEGDVMLEEVEAMDVVGQLHVTKATSSKTVMQPPSRSSVVKKGRARKGRSLKDSGIGMEADEEMA